MGVDHRVVIPLVADGDPAPCCRVSLSEATGWDVQVEIDHRIVTTTHCTEWHRVERMCGEIRRIWCESHTASSARR
jgi:hypothetical protein